MTKLTKKGGKKPLSSKNLQVELLKFFVIHSKKRYNAGQLRGLLSIANSKHSIKHALEQLEIAGSISDDGEGRYAMAFDNLITTPEKSQNVAGDNTDHGKKSDKAIENTNKSAKGLKEKIKKTVSKAEKTEEKPAHKAPQSQRKGDKTYEGRVDMTRSGSAFIICDFLDKDVFVTPRHLNGAMNGDTVEIVLFPIRRRKGGDSDRRREGRIVRIVKRATDYLIGTIRFSRKYALLIPDHATFTGEIFIPKEDTGTAKDGDKVIVKLNDIQDGKTHVLKGKVTTVLGKIGGNDFEMNKILINQGFNLTFPPEVLAEAEAIPEGLPDQEIARRRDFRNTLTFTIDPADARDFDDAISYKKLESGDTEIGIHIADVTHYVRPGSALDKEALERSTSVYLVDRVCPMLPEKLSNNLCSLVPHQDRPVFSAVFVFDKNDKIKSRWFGKSVIYSAHRFAYEEAQTVLEKNADESITNLPIFEDLENALLDLNRLAHKMRKEREKQGAISFESDEIRFKLAPDGTPLEAYVKERKDAHLLIEDYMLLANKEVAIYMDNLGKDKQTIPFVYRVHDLPDMEKVADFARFAQELGVKMKIDTPKQIAESYNRLMLESHEDDRLKLLQPLAIRTMAKAIYTTENIGHYGLGFTHYTHFTSPIRRYADVWVHRILDRNLDGQKYRVDKTKLEEQCQHISNQEKRAADAERESIKFKQVELISNHIGDEFEGTISGIIDRGIFVELPGSKAEGLLEFRLMDDMYVVAENRLQVRGTRYGNVLSMGDKIRVKVLAADPMKRQIEFGYAGE